LEFSLHSSWIHMLIRLGPQYVLSKSIIECQVNGKCLKFNFNLQWFAIINPRGLETDLSTHQCTIHWKPSMTQ
jgi:hypothetical protein